MSHAGSYFEGTTAPAIETLTGNVGGPVGPTNFNIDIKGTGAILVTGDPPQSELIISVAEATENQLGVVIYGDNNDAILGVLDNVAVHPEALQAKIGDQTAFGLAYGNGSGTAIQWTPAGQTGQVLLGVDNAAPVWTGPAKDGEVLIGATGGQAEWAQLVEGSNVTITNSANQIIISATGGGGTGSGIDEIGMDNGTVIDDGSGVIQLLGDTNITTEGDGAQTGQVTLNDNVTIPGTFETTAGYFELPTTTASLGAGVIRWNNVPFIHMYGDNFFAGSFAGNGSLTTAEGNVGIGTTALTRLTTGTFNTAIGLSQFDNKSSSFNVSMGHNSLGSLESGLGSNVAIGSSSGFQLITGEDNTLLGDRSGASYTGSESSNICVGNEGQTGDNNVMRLGESGTGSGEVDETYVAGVYQRTGNTDSEVTLTDSDGQVTTTGQALNGQVLIGSTGNRPQWSTLTAGSNMTITEGPNSITLSSSGGGGGGAGSGGVIVTKYTSNDTWNKNGDTSYIVLLMWGGGSGGGSGRQGASDAAGGGGGGAGGGFVYMEGPADLFGNSLPVVVGSGGVGGASVATHTTDGNDGSAGGRSSFGSIQTESDSPSFGGGGSSLTAAGGRGRRARNGYGVYGLEAFPGGRLGTEGFGNGNPGIDASAPTASFYYAGATGGGGGAGASTSTEFAGGGSNGATSADQTTVILSGATGGTESGTIDGGAGNSLTSINYGFPLGGTGGAGGGGQHTGPVAGNGGDGGIPGGGGGGGAGSLNGTPSGSGGDGGRGEVWVVEFLANTTATDYDAGTWVPSFEFTGASVQPTMSIASARYVKIGDVVHVTVNATMTDKGTAPLAAALTISNFPYSTSGLDNYLVVRHLEGGSGNLNNLFAKLNNTSSAITTFDTGATFEWQNAANGDEFNISQTYQVI